MINVVVINGGRGAASIIPHLNKIDDFKVVSIVNAFDDGKSTGKIRKLFGVLGPSDIRKVQELMLPKDDKFYKQYLDFFSYRFPENISRSFVVNEISKFCEGKQDSLCGIEFIDDLVKSSIKKYLSSFIEALLFEEKFQAITFDFSDCSIMNCVYAGAIIFHERNLEKATKSIEKIFRLSGSVRPSSISDKTLVAVREDGEFLSSEAEIVELRSNVRIERIFFVDNPIGQEKLSKFSKDEKIRFLEIKQGYVELSKGAKSALSEADIIIYAPGTQHSSLYPTYMTHGLAETIADNKVAFKVFITNIGADYETPSYRASDFFKGAFKYFNLLEERDFKENEMADLILVNEKRLKEEISYVELDREALEKIPLNVKIDDYEDETNPGKHDGQLIIKTIMNQYYSRRR